MFTHSYRNYLKSQRWQQKRQQVFARYGKKCYACDTRQGPIQVHHLSYSNLGREPLEDLIPLCKKCHLFVTRYHRRYRRRGLRLNTKMAIAIIKKSNGPPTR